MCALIYVILNLVFIVMVTYFVTHLKGTKISEGYYLFVVLLLIFKSCKLHLIF